MPELRILTTSDYTEPLQHPWSTDNLPTEGELVYGVSMKVTHANLLYADELRLLRMHAATRFTTNDWTYWGCNDLGWARFTPRGVLLIPEVAVHEAQSIPAMAVVQRNAAVDHLAWFAAHQRDLAERRRVSNTELEASLTRIFKPVVETAAKKS